MITLDVHSFNGSPLPQSLSAGFDEMGGTIGRADSNQLVLPDPERTISRVHAQVVFRNGSYSIVDRGSNPISINGRPLGSGQESALRAGDELHIGGYAIRVAVAAAAGAATPGSSDPFADFGFGAPPAPPPPPMPVAKPPAAVAAAASSSLDPLAAFGMAPAPSPTASPARAPLAGGIPEDWNPFAPDASAHAPSPHSSSSGLGMGGFGLESRAAAPAPLIPGMSTGGSSSDSSLDALFGLHAPSGGDPLANSLLDAPAAQPNMAADADPLRSLNSATRASSASAADQLSDLNRPFIAAPVASPPRPLPTPPAPVNPGNVPPPVASAGNSAAVLSWDDPSGQNRTVIRPKAVVAAAAPAPAIARPIAVEPTPPPVAAAAAAATVNGTPDALAQALCEGLGVAALPGGPLTPATMRLIGELLHEATRGTVELLIARAALKREVRAEVTKIVARENNPLKFSPNVEVAMNYLLGPATRGFTAPGPAMRDAYDDLRAHQFAFLAGMRAALEGVLKRFDPTVLEGRLTQKSFLATLIPATRKAQMWEVFQQLYSQISTEAADDFHELFGKEFLRAYEAHIDELQKDKP